MTEKIGEENGYTVYMASRLSGLRDALNDLHDSGVDLSKYDWNGFDDGGIYSHRETEHGFSFVPHK